MKKSLVASFTILLFLLSTSIVFAKIEAEIESDNPAVGETIKIYVPNAIITAKITDITPGNPSEAPFPQNVISDVTEFVQAKASQYLNFDNFTENNPVKNGIAQLNEKINEQVGKWFKLDLSKKDSTPQEDKPINFSKLPAELFGAIKPHVTGKYKYIYLGIATALVVALLIFFGRRKKPIQEDSED